MDNQSLALQTVRHYVWSGFYEPVEIQERICEELFEPGTIDTAWVRQRIDEEFQNKVEAEAAWAPVTDCDCLDQAFRVLEGKGVIALQNAGYTLSDGISDVSHVYQEAG